MRSSRCRADSARSRKFRGVDVVAVALSPEALRLSQRGRLLRPVVFLSRPRGNGRFHSRQTAGFGHCGNGRRTIVGFIEIEAPALRSTLEASLLNEHQHRRAFLVRGRFRRWFVEISQLLHLPAFFLDKGGRFEGIGIMRGGVERMPSDFFNAAADLGGVNRRAFGDAFQRASAFGNGRRSFNSHAMISRAAA